MSSMTQSPAETTSIAITPPWTTSTVADMPLYVKAIFYHGPFFPMWHGWATDLKGDLRDFSEDQITVRWRMLDADTLEVDWLMAAKPRPAP